MTPSLRSFSRFNLRALSLLLLLLSSSLLAPAQSIRYVKPAASGSGNGSSWANASGNLQAMINASVATDQVWVAAGTYKPTTGTDRNASFAMKIGVLIYGGFAGSETSLSQRPVINTTTPSSTTLSGNIGNAGSTADNSYHVISNPMDLINTAVLDGFIITGGNANGGSSAGGGMYNPGNDSGLGASPTVRNCSFQGNSAGIGGAIHNYGSATSNPVLVNCLFRDNSATISGGAIYNYKNSGARGNPVLTNCSFQTNSAVTSGGAIFNLGYFSNCAPVLTNCSFQNNSAPQGGAFYNDGTQFYSRPKLTNCVLFGNGGSNSIRNSSDSYVEAIYSLFEAGAAFTNGLLGSNVSGVTVNPFASTNSVALNACAPAINSGNNDAYNQYNGTPTDLAGNPRFFPSGGQIDMGAVEFQAAPQSITITPPSASYATIGTAFSQFFSASGGSGPYILASGSLPPGITLATSGVLSGTPTQYGSYTFTVKVVDPVTGCSGLSAPYTLLVRSDRPIRYVKVGGTGNGDSWANASGDLQSQINVAGAEQVWVAAGTYKPTTGTDRIISFAMRTGVAIYGGFVGNETALSNRPAINPVRGNPSSTILSGDIGVVGNNADNSYHVILNRDGLTSTAILDGFVITGGNANRDGYSYEGGGGMANICQNPAGAISPTVRNCSFQGNTATLGGAIFNDASSSGNVYPQECNPTLINCVFQDNSARAGGAVSNNASGGSFCSPQFDNCYFINNAANNGGAMDNYSGSRSQSNVRLTNCLFQGNAAADAGGAISNAASGGSSYPVLINCSFQGNSIKAGAGSRLGGAIYFSTLGDITGATLTNCSFQGNTASQGGAIYVNSYQANSTTNVDLISCVVFGNGGDGTFVAGNVSQNSYGLIYLSNTLIEASATKYQNRGGNITTSTSPFASPNSPALAANSPAVNAGTSGVQGTDVAGNPRIVGCRIDLGAYELQYDPAVAITAQPAASSVVCGRASVSVPVGVSGQYLTYQWYKDSFANPVTGQTSATLTLANVQPANAGSYSLVVTGSCNSLTSTAFTLMVNQPTVSISPVSATICQGKSVLLTASGASTYTWSNTTTGNTLSATTAGTYSVTGVDGNGCTNTATAVVTENKPTVSISPVSATICQGKSVLLTASGASTYTWSNNTTDNPLTATTAGTYSVTGVDGNGCFNSATAVVTENKPTVSISPNPASICQASSVLLTASGASTYTWSNNTTSNTLSATTVGTYSVTGVAANGCFNSATATVTDNRPIVSITATPSATVTQGASITLTASGTGATSFAWSSGSTSNSTVINPATSAPYSVTVRNGAGCITVASLDITVTPVVCGPVIYVTQTGSGQRDGSSWANALGSSQLQFGINTAADCGNNGQVWVAAGTYKPTTGNDRNASFALRNGVTIYGGFVGNETALTDRPAYNPVANRPASTTLSGDIGTVGNISDNSFRVISNPTSLSLTATAVLDGFVITGGAGGTLGGGMFNDGSSPTLRNCSFVGNSVLASGSTISRGGAIYNGNGSSPQLYNCYFLTNSASSSASTNSFGGAMANLNSSNPQLTNCNFVNNWVSGSAQNQGGAIANNLNSSPQLINCSFLNNSASGGTSSRGGAVANGNVSNPQLINCSFLNNSVSGSTNTTNNQGGAVYNNFCTPQLTNCVLFGNGGANTFYNVNGGSVVDYSLLETTVVSFTAGTGNLTTDVSPFVSAADTRLNGCSPAINAGDNGANTTTTDLDGNPRIYAGTLARIDMGAYEYQGVAGVVTTVPTVNTATVGVAFSQNFTASGGSGPYSYSLASGSLPPGLSLSSTGVLSGTPTQTGSFTITVSATNASSCLGVSAPYVLTVIDAASPNPTLAGFTASPGAVCVGSVATFTAMVGNVTGNYNYTLTNGLGAPLKGSTSGSPFSQSITASGTGTQNFTLTVSASGQSASSVTALTVNPSPVARLINNGPLTCAQSSVTLTASGGSSYTFASGSGVLGTPGPINTVVVSTSGTYSVSVASASGCVSTTSTVVTADQTVPSISVTPSSATLSCASPTVSLTAVGNSPVRWSTGETTSIILVNVAGPYSVTATGSNGCTAVASTSVSQDNTAPVASLVSSGSLTCSVTSVTLTASPSGQSYSFSGLGIISSIGNTAVVNASGTYSVTVVSASNGCSSLASTSVSQDNTAPVASLVSSGSLSCSVTSVILTASPNGQTYNFNGPGVVSRSGNTAVVNASGIYSVTVISANGCSSVASTSVSQDNTAPIASLVSSGSLTCSVSSVTLTASPSGQVYRFSSGASQIGTSNQAVVSASGTYSVTVVSANGCTAVASVSVGQDNTAPVASLVSSGSLSCSVTSVTLTASPNGLSYQFSSGASQIGNTNQATVSSAGMYSVTVLSANGCSSVASTTVVGDVTVPTASLTNNGPISCLMSLVTLTARGGDAYRFSNGATQVGNGPTATVSSSGTYSVTVISANGCSSVASTTVVGDVTVPTASLTSNGPISCSTASVTLTASGGGAYRFSSGATQVDNGNTATVTTAGIYSVTVTGDNGCTATASTTVTGDQTVPVASLTNDGPLSCTKTTVTLTASGSGRYSFSAGATQMGNGNTATVSSAGTYSVTVTGTNGCTATASTLVTGDQSAPIATLTNDGPLSCTKTRVTLTASGGVNYTFAGPGLSQTGPTATASVTTAGIYSVTVTNANNCSATASTTVTSSTAAVAIANPTVTTATVGQAFSQPFTATGGISPYSYSVTSGSLPTGLTLDTTGVLSGTPTQSGSFTITVLGQDATGCSGVGAAYVLTVTAANPTLTGLAASPGAVCVGNVVTFTATVGNLTGSYTYTLTNGLRAPLTGSSSGSAFSQSVTAVGTGTQSFTLIVSANGQTASSETALTVNPLPVASLTNNGPLTCAQSSVTLTAGAAGVPGNSYTFASSSGVLGTPGPANSVVVSTAGTYSVTVASASGCVSTTSTLVTADQTAPSVSIISSSATLTCGSPTVSLTAVGSGSVRWSTGETTPVISVSVAGPYSVTVLSANGCSSVASTSVGQDNTAPVASLVSSGSLTCSVTSVTLTASPNGQRYVFSSGATQIGTSNQAVVSASGTYSVTVLSANGCSAVASTSVGQDNSVPLASLVSSGTLTCAITSVTLTANPNGLSYVFSGGATQLGSSNQAVVNASGTYSVTVLSANGCSAVASTTVAGDVTVPEAGLTNNGPLSCLMSLVTLTARGGDAYRFSNGATQVGNGPTATVSTAGGYSVTVVSANGCTATASTTVVSDQGEPTASLTTNGPISCSTTSVTLTASPSGQRYQFSGGATQIGNTNQAVVGVAGPYSVTVISANGCSSVASASVGQDNTAPVASLVSSGSLTCSVTSVTLTANPNGQNYQFSSGASQIGNTNQAVVTASGTYSVTVLSANGCTSVAQTTVNADQNRPIVSITPSSATLTCASPSVSLTAVGSGSVHWSTGETTPSILVRAAGTYSVTLTSGNGCTASTHVVISQDQQVPTASIAANPSLTIAQGQSAMLTASATSVQPFGFRWSTGQTTTSISVSAAGPYSVSVTGANGCSATTSVVLSLTSAPIVEAPFAITAVTTLNCTPILPNRYSISFTPRYSGLTGQSVAFRVVNELLPTTELGPYTIQLYTDNPRIRISAVQTGTPGEVTFDYDWLAACLASTAANTPPRLVTVIPPQSATVGVGYSYVIPPGTFTDDQTPGSLRLNAQGLPPGISLSGYTLSGVASTTVGSPFRVILTATDPGNLSVSTSFGFVVAPSPVEPPQPSQPFAITGVSLLSCTPIADRININFSPRYVGLTGQPIAFRIENELAATNEPGPYSLTLYRDNPVITLKATQTGSVSEASFAYNWLAACATQGQDNTPPRVVSPVGNQTVVAGTTVNLNLANVFLDQETPQGLSLSATGLPSGLVLVGTAIQGVASTTGVSTVIVTATDGGGLSASTGFTLTVTAPNSPTVGEPSGFTITGVQTLSCVVMSGGQRAVTFQPQYVGTNGGPINFSVINERAATTDPGPYTLTLYTDNPTITLSAQQGSTVATYRYNWLAGCTPAARVGSGEASSRLQVRVLGNPIEGNKAQVEISGVMGQSVQLNLVDLQGKPVHAQRIDQAGVLERVSLPLGAGNGVLLLQVSTPTQYQQVKLLRTN